MTDVFFIKSPHTRLAYREYHHSQAPKGSCLMLLHGAGVGGELTWDAMLPYLTNWETILVPDLKGMGESYGHSGEEEPVSVIELAEDIHALTQFLQWQTFDVIGYSLGGLVTLLLNQLRIGLGLPKLTKMALLEPAALDRVDLFELQELRNKYRAASDVIRETGDVELGVSNFMDGVSPNRRKQTSTETIAKSRLAHRPFGFAYALDSVTELVDEYVKHSHLRDDLLRLTNQVLILSGGISHQSLIQHYDVLESQFDGWRHQSIVGADHSLPFQKPRKIGKILDNWFSLKEP
ncbi:alpha/beta fold hydrolase [Marinomonas sp. 2405UD68-3]|uniref:alpha/beta fold hydrolase n=1 Tax=Marinomonas sp. 2405UD68-3 TaxID=3391835 RepID=UPI0039C986D0